MKKYIYKKTYTVSELDLKRISWIKTKMAVASDSELIRLLIAEKYATLFAN